MLCHSRSTKRCGSTTSTSTGSSATKYSSTTTTAITSISNMPDTAAPAAAPTRTQRQLCWEHRDKYFACLESRGVTVPPGTDMSDGRGPVGKAAAADQAREEKERAGKKNEARAQDPCKELRGGYEDNCARSWVSHVDLCTNNLLQDQSSHPSHPSHPSRPSHSPQLPRSTTSTNDGSSKRVKNSCTHRQRRTGQSTGRLSLVRVQRVRGDEAGRMRDDEVLM